MKNLSLLETEEKITSTALVLSVIGMGASCIAYQNHYLTAALVIVSLILTFLLVKSFGSKLRNLTELTKTIDEGQWPETKDNSKESAIKTQLKSLHYKMREVLEFVQSLGEKEFEFQHIDPNGKVGTILSTLSDKQNTYLEQERKRNWKNEGLAKFGELLRTNDRDLKDISLTILSKVITYIGANQGGFFIADEKNGQRYMELTACYAYDRKKFIETKIEEGQGLLGQVMLEKDTIFITDVPTDFVNITSGLGEAVPTNIVIIPLMVNDNFYGAIELASFKTLEPYKMEFLEELAENIASTVAAVKTNEHTRNLLEHSQEMAQELQSREEEMRQSMEELQATQEEMNRNQEDLNGLFTALNTSQGLVEFDSSGNLISANERMLAMLECSLEDLKFNRHSLLPSDDQQSWVKLKNGNNIYTELSIVSETGKNVWLAANYSSVMDNKGEFKKVLMLASDISVRKEKEKVFERLSLVADNTDNSVIISDASGNIEYVNQGFTRLSGYSLEEMMGQNLGEILLGPDTDQETVKSIDENIRNKKSLNTEILNYNKAGEPYWISLAINPVFNAEGDINKFISVQANITATKEKALDYHYKLEAISRANAVIEFDITGNILEANDNFLSIFRYQKEEILGKHHEMFVHKADRDSMEYKNLWKALGQGECISKEFKRIDRGGNEIWLKSIYNPIFDLNGNTIKIVKFATDITRERQLQIETELQQKEIKSHLETIDKTIASLEFDMEGKISYVNQVYLDVSGYSEEELLGNNYEFLLPEEEINKPQTQMMWMSLKDGNYFTGQYKQKSKSGKSLWLSGTFNPILDDGGKPQKVMMFAQFNTTEKEKQEDLIQTVNALKNSAPLIEFNAEGLFKSGNSQFFEIFGYSRLELRQKPIEYLFRDAMPKSQLSNFLKRMKRHEFIDEILSIETKDGDKKIYRITFSPVYNMEQEFVKTIAILLDEISTVSLKAG